VPVTLLLVVVAAIAGIAIGRSLPPSATNRTASPPTANLPPGRAGTNAGGNSGYQPSSPLNLGQDPTNRTGSGGPRNARAIAARVDPALVDINTDLSYLGDESAGTGIVLSANGLVLTNNHVIDGATSIRVTDIGNHRTYVGTVVGYDQALDVAVIKCQGARRLTTARLGDGRGTRVGQPIVAIGNAGGKDGTPVVAPGSITGLNQSIKAKDEGNGTIEQLSGLIQTDADVQPGDSGGSLVDAGGTVVGMDTAAASRSGTNPAQGFAIPINTASSIARAIEAGRASGAVHIGPTAFLGVMFKSGKPAISSVVPGTAAQRAGLTTGDRITSLDGHNVASPEALTRVLVGYHPGQRISIGWVTSAGDAGRATVVLGRGPAA